MRTVMVAAAVLMLVGCDDGFDTRTFELQHMSPDDAIGMIEPYVPGGTENIRGTRQPATLTITAPAVRLEQIEQVLAAYDRPANVQLRFQIIEADGFTSSDAAIADVEQALRDLFRFQGYRLVAEVVAQARAPGRLQQRVVADEDRPFTITAGIERVVRREDGGAVELSVELAMFNSTLLATSLIVPSGQTVVVGSARAQADGNTIILVVRPLIE